MTGFTFSPATQEQSRLRLALIGPSGSGKTFTALRLATTIGQRVAFIDTERGSASKYARLFSFDVLQLQQFDPRKYVEAIHAAETAGYDVVVIDSLSHAWMGVGGALELVDQAQKRSQSGNSFAAWRDVTPLHNQLVDALLGCEAHLIATMRAKTEYVQEKDERGRTVIRKVGLAPVQRDGLEYEFDVVGDMDQDNTLIVTKTRCPELHGAVIPKPGEPLARTLMAWLGQGEPPAPRPDPTEAAAAHAVAEQTVMESQAQQISPASEDHQPGSKSADTGSAQAVGERAGAPTTAEASGATDAQRVELIQDRGDPLWVGWLKLREMATAEGAADIPTLTLPVRREDLELVGKDLKNAIKRAREAKGAAV